MRRVDYINQEPVMCFLTPILNLDTIKQNDVEFSKGDFVHFNNKSTVPTSTIFYKYKKNLLIIDIDREKPIVHIILNSKVSKTIELGKLKREQFFEVEQVIDIYGKEIKINSFTDISTFYNEFLEFKQQKNDLYKEAKLKLQELIESSDRMKKFDKIAGTSKVVELINKENFREIKSKLSFIFSNRQEDIQKYKQELVKSNNLNSFIVISNILDSKLYEDFKTKNKEHINLLSIANKSYKQLSESFNSKWFINEQFLKEKKLGALFDCFNEMFCSKIYTKEEVELIEDLIAKNLKEDSYLLNSFLDWVDLCLIDKEDMKESLEEIITNSKSRKLLNKEMI